MLLITHHSPTSDGGGAAIVCSEEFVKRHGLEGQAVEIVAMEMVTDLPSTFNEESCMKMVSATAVHIVTCCMECHMCSKDSHNDKTVPIITIDMYM